MTRSHSPELHIRAAIRALLLGCLFLVAASLSSGVAKAAPARAWFWLSSDQIRALRDVSPVPVLIISWKRHTDVIEPPRQANAEIAPPDKHPDAQGTLVLGPDYFVIDDPADQEKIYDFKLQRIFVLEGARKQFTNMDLLALVAFADAEAQNRNALGHAFGAIGFKMAMSDQPYYEAALGVRTRSVAPLRLTLSQDGNSRNFSYNGETLVTVRDGTSPLTPQQGALFAKALRYLDTFHPAAVDALQPLRTLPMQISGVREEGAYKNRNTYSFELLGQESRPYPLAAGLTPIIHPERGERAGFASQLIDIGLKAVSGAAGPRPTAQDYVADANQAFAAGDGLGAWLAWTALSLHYPDQSALCDGANAPSWCANQKQHMQKATQDPRFRKIAESAALCSSEQSEKGAQVLKDVDVAGEKHGYVATEIMACLLRGIGREKAAALTGSHFAPTSEENELRAYRANPFIPGFYYDTGMALVDGWDFSGWDLLEIGEALGGGVKGDPYDQHLNPMKRELMARYPEHF